MASGGTLAAHEFKPPALSERLLNFGAAVLKLTRKLHKDGIDYHLVRQIVKSATSAGANYQEACAAESRADFIHKLQISLKELNETHYWLQLIGKGYDSISTRELTIATQENKELCAIIAQSIITAKTRSVSAKLSHR